jgi:hypothetical protein
VTCWYIVCCVVRTHKRVSVNHVCIISAVLYIQQNFVRTFEQDEELGLNDIDTHASTGAESHEKMVVPTRKDFDMAGKKTYS